MRARKEEERRREREARENLNRFRGIADGGGAGTGGGGGGGAGAGGGGGTGDNIGNGEGDDGDEEWIDPSDATEAGEGEVGTRRGTRRLRVGVGSASDAHSEPAGTAAAPADQSPPSPDARAGDVTTRTGYEAVEGIAKMRAEPFRRGSSTVTVGEFGFKVQAQGGGKRGG